MQHGQARGRESLIHPPGHSNVRRTCDENGEFPGEVSPATATARRRSTTSRNAIVRLLVPVAVITVTTTGDRRSNQTAR